MPPKRRVTAHATRTRWSNADFGNWVARIAYDDIDDFIDRTFGFHVDLGDSDDSDDDETKTFRIVVTGAERAQNRGPYNRRTDIQLDTYRYHENGTLDVITPVSGELSWFFNNYLWGRGAWDDFRRYFDDPPPNIEPVGEVCALCLDTVDSVQEAKILGCRHVYHRDCWNDYLSSQSMVRFSENYRKCPTCRQIVRQRRRSVKT